MLEKNILDTVVPIRAAPANLINGAALEGAALLTDIEAFCKRFVAYPSEHASIAHTLWIAHAHAMEAWESTPRIAFLSPEPGSGKTRALEVSELLVPNPVEAINASVAYLFRKISDEKGAPTILYDEIDTVFGPKAKDANEEIRGVLNAGHRRGAVAGRCVMRGKTVETEELPAYCAVAIAGLGHLPDTILTRSIIIKMLRRAPAEVVEPFRRRVLKNKGYALRDRLAAWTRSHLTAFENARPEMPEGIEDRNADVWEALLAVADEAGGEWPSRARVAAVTLVTDAIGGRQSIGIRLLGDLRTVFKGETQMPTKEILSALCALEDAPWSDLKGSALDSRRLAHFLSEYGVSRTTFRIGSTTAKGYRAADLRDAWIRYLSPAPTPPIATVTAVTEVTPEDDPDLLAWLEREREGSA
jgi:Protein of unknown function (DUF3631)